MSAAVYSSKLMAAVLSSSLLDSLESLESRPVTGLKTLFDMDKQTGLANVAQLHNSGACKAA